MGGVLGAAAVLAFLAAPDCQLGRIGQAHWMPCSPTPHEQTRRWKEAELQQLQGLGTLRPGLTQGAPASHLCSDQLPPGLPELSQPLVAKCPSQSPLSRPLWC